MNLFSVTFSAPLKIQPTTLAGEYAARQWASAGPARICVAAVSADDARQTAERYAMGEPTRTDWRGKRGAVPVIAA